MNIKGFRIVKFQGHDIRTDTVVSVDPVTTHGKPDWKFGFVVRMAGNKVTITIPEPPRFGRAGGVNRAQYLADTEKAREEFIGLLWPKDEADRDKPARMRLTEIARWNKPAKESKCCGRCDGIHDICDLDIDTESQKPDYQRCGYLEADQYRSRVLTGSIGLEGPWSEWQDGKPEKTAMNREYQYRKAAVEDEPLSGVNESERLFSENQR